MYVIKFSHNLMTSSSNSLFEVCISFYSFVMQCGATTEWTVIKVLKQVTKRFLIHLQSSYKFTEHADLFYWIIIVPIATFHTNHSYQ